MHSEPKATDSLRRVAVICTAFGLLASMGLVVGCGLNTADSEPQFPSGPVFDHASHLDKGLECIDCHEGAEDEDEAGMPEWDFCLECHEDLDEERGEGEKLADLFMDPDGTPRWHNVTAQDEDVIFSHTTHVASDVACGDCHSGIEQSMRVSFDLRQDMDDCMTE